MNCVFNMTLRSLRLFRTTSPMLRMQMFSSSVIYEQNIKTSTLINKEYKTEDSLIYLGDHDTFGSLSGYSNITDSLENADEGDIKEENFNQNIPLSSQKFTTKQYADLIKQYLKHKRLKEALDVLEVRMLKEDRVKPENYIYNILIGACAEVGYTKKAFKLYNDMKRRALKPTGDTYTCLFQACYNSPWLEDGLKRAHHLRNMMIEKSVEPNVTNYNSMIKAFGRCGDLTTAFKIIDEMISKKIKIRVHTYNHLLHACITDKTAGLRHALVVWRKMLKNREKPNIFSFNLMLKCVKECNLGTEESIQEIISIIQQHSIDNSNKKRLLIDSPVLERENQSSIANQLKEPHIDISNQTDDLINNKDLVTKQDSISMQLVDKSKLRKTSEVRIVPNLLSKVINMNNVLTLKTVTKLHDKFAVIGGQEDFLKEMEVYSVKPDLKTFTQMLFLLDDNREAETKLIETMKSLEILADIDFYNMLIKKRCIRSDYDGAMEVRELIAQDMKYRKKKFPLKKKVQLKENIMTFGVIAMACRNKESADKLIEEMEKRFLKINIEILGTLLRQGTARFDFPYVLRIMDIVKTENIKLNDTFINHLETFCDRCASVVKQKHNTLKISQKEYSKFLHIYKNWLKEMKGDDALLPEHPWTQFREPQPKTIQKDGIEIKEPKKWYKRSRKYVPYAPPI